MPTTRVSANISLLIFAAILIFVAFYLTLLRADAVIKNTAIDGCAQSARFEKKEGAGTTIYPVYSFYEDCLKRKGI